ncbi:hypothetical protein JZ751_027846, partial [Albula glossodonta]
MLTFGAPQLSLPVKIDIEPACCRFKESSPCELPSDLLLSMKPEIMADGPRCKRRKQANPRRKN